MAESSDRDLPDHTTTRPFHPRRGSIRSTHPNSDCTFPDLSQVIDPLARFMFDLQADDFGADDVMRELAWADDRIRDFWLDQARAVLAFLDLGASA